MSFGEKQIWVAQESVDGDDVDGAVRLLKDVFGVLLVESGDPFERCYMTPHIHASEHDIDTGAAQREAPCGDQTPAYFGINGPIYI